jgi:hypothetical protein
MNEHVILDRSPMQVFVASLHGGLAPGEIGAVVGRAGIGKSAFLVQIGLDRLLRGRRVLHVSLSASAEHVRSFYDEIFNGLVKAAGAHGVQDALALQLERGRLIHAYPGSSLSAQALDSALDRDDRLMGFRPEVVLYDGAPDEADLSALAALAESRGFALWTVARTHREEGGVFEQAGRFSTVITLEPSGDHVRLGATKVHGDVPDQEMGLELDPESLLVVGEDVWDPDTGPWSPSVDDCTLFSGGAPGAESVFGELAETWGIREVNFSFEGHDQARDSSRYTLSDQELSSGDVSLLYVKRRLNRKFAGQGPKIKKVLQTLWHQVSRAQQVFVVGMIQENDTVVGGTGWSVELARMWHKDLWVFDQERLAWFKWDGQSWNRGVPVITAPLFCGTGSRKTEDGTYAALQALFQRSFGETDGEEA